MDIRDRFKYRLWNADRQHMHYFELPYIDYLFVYERNIIMQSTNIYDKNHQLIYEGDIIFIDINTPLFQIVIFRDSSFGLCDEKFLMYPFNLLGRERYSTDDLEVISNIFEHEHYIVFAKNSEKLLISNRWPYVNKIRDKYFLED